MRTQLFQKSSRSSPPLYSIVVSRDAVPMSPKSEGLGETSGNWLLPVASSKVLQDVLSGARNGYSEIKGGKRE